MSLDALDAAFIRRLAVVQRHEPAASRPLAQPAAPDVATDAQVASPSPAVKASSPPAAHVPVVGAEPGGPAAAVPPLTLTMEAQLLELARDEWRALADHVEGARLRGRRVIAVAGGRAGEGRTTLVRCLAATLRARGREVLCAEPHDLAVTTCGLDGLGPTHDKRIVLVDAGVWFPPGPIRRSRLQVASLGCEAAILVRRAGAQGGLARQAALEALGIEVLGEVLTFTTPLAADEDLDGDAAA